MKKQTAVEYLLEQMGLEQLIFPKEIIDKALEMEEKQQEALAIGFGEWLNTEEPLALILDLNGYQDFSELLEIYKKRNLVNENEMKNSIFNQEPKFKLNSFCETPEINCSMNYCDENGCQNRKRVLVEESKQETLKEAAHEYFKRGQLGFEKASDTEEAFLSGGLWQAEQMKEKYSEEDLKQAFHIGRLYQGREGDTNFEQWFEQFKKK
jgi:hypothetical protein